MRNDLETHLFLACRVIKEQNGLIVGYREKLRQEETEREQFHKKLGSLSKDFEFMKERYEQDKVERGREARNVEGKLELQREFQAQVNEELRKQIHGLRGNTELTKVQVNEKATPMSFSPLLVKKNEKKRLSSEGSPCSSVNSLFIRPTQHRAELVWRIGAFSRKLRKIQSGAHEEPYISEPFTTGPFGYRISVWIYLNGRGNTTNCISVYVRIMAGEFDPVLVWPIKPVYTFILLDQNPDVTSRHNHIRTRDLSIKHGGIDRPKKEEKSVIVGFDDFIVHDQLEKNSYLVEDSIFLRVLVDVPDQ